MMFSPVPLHCTFRSIFSKTGQNLVPLWSKQTFKGFQHLPLPNQTPSPGHQVTTLARLSERYSRSSCSTFGGSPADHFALRLLVFTNKTWISARKRRFGNHLEPWLIQIETTPTLQTSKPTTTFQIVTQTNFYIKTFHQNLLNIFHNHGSTSTPYAPSIEVGPRRRSKLVAPRSASAAFLVPWRPGRPRCLDWLVGWFGLVGGWDSLVCCLAKVGWGWLVGWLVKVGWFVG